MGKFEQRWQIWNWSDKLSLRYEHRTAKHLHLCTCKKYVCGLGDHSKTHLSLSIVYNICSSFWGLWPVSVENGSLITQCTLNPMSFQWTSSEGECIPQSPLTGDGGTSVILLSPSALLPLFSICLKAELEPGKKSHSEFDMKGQAVIWSPRAFSCTSYTSNSLGFLKSRVSQAIHYP